VKEEVLVHHKERIYFELRFDPARAPACNSYLKLKRRTIMFARILDFEVKLEKKEEFVKVVKNEIVPILVKQTGFLEILPFFPEKMKEEKAITISL
jgi:hypothetical protein